ncbi:response regulator [Motilibacter deserti]|uniref:Response regulator transcription factor n=1 Tax=Motilibacter deserti TaxID=2714956 RepID=A0ABX0GQZ1_9ACTN|nr:response regulator transcription factor [Motilibacter deserti]NHC12195.1 response regulator transcription factor [Motilibacter deserti]
MSDHEQRAIRVLVVDDHEMVASSVALVLEQEPDIEVVGIVGTLAAARERVALDPPDVVLLDHRLPDGRGVDEIPRVKQIAPSAKIVVVTAATDDATLVAATEAGCSGFLSKSGKVDDLVAAVRAASVGEVLVSPALLSRLLPRLHRVQRGLGSDLTPRELEVLVLIAEGLGNAAIGERLSVSVNTVRNHVANILAKLGVHSKLEALAVAVREGLLPTSDT